MHSSRERLAVAGIELPPPLLPGGKYEPFVWSGQQLLIAGQIPRRGEEVQFEGVVGINLSVEEGQEAARLSAINTLAVVAAACGDLESVRLVSLNGFIRCTPDFAEQARLMDGASQLFLDVLGERGRHVRTAVGVYALPRRVPVEISAVFTVDRTV